MSNSNIMSVREMIDLAFGDPQSNVVDHKLTQTILYLLARQLRLLERFVEVKMGPRPSYVGSGTSLSVTELKIHAMQKKRKKVTRPGEKDKSSSDRTSTDKTSSDKTSTDKTSTDKTSTDKTSTDMMSTDKTSTDKTSTEMTSTDKTSTDKTSTTKTSSDKTSTDKTSTDKTSTDKTSTDKTSTDYGSSSYKTSTGVISSDKASYDKDRASKSSSSGKAKALKGPSPDRAGAAKPKLEKYQKLLEAIEERRERELRVIPQRADSFGEPGKEPTPMASLDSVEAKYEKLLVVERVPSDEAKARAGSDSRRRMSQLSIVNKEEFEELQDEVQNLLLRLAPIPPPGFPENAQLMEDLRKGASLTDAMAALQLSARLEATEKTILQILSIVTDLAGKSNIDVIAPRDDFMIKERLYLFNETPLEVDGSKNFQRNINMILKYLFNKTLLEAETAEILGPKIGLDTGIGMDGTADTAAGGGVDDGGTADFGGNVGAQGLGSGDGTGAIDSADASAGIEMTPGTGVDTEAVVAPVIAVDTGTSAGPPAKDEPSTPSQTQLIGVTLPQPLEEGEVHETTDEKEKVENTDCVTYDELDNAMQELSDEIMKKVKSITNRTTTVADNAFKLATKLDGKLNSELNLGNRMTDLEALITDYAEQINVIDSSLSSQMTNYQEQLTQMQHDLEMGLETMTEILANAGGDTVAVAELNTQFSNIQFDFETMTDRQKELTIDQNSLSLDLEALWKQIELLRESKADREEVADAMRDKAGIGALNGLVSLEQFEAVRGDFEKRIGAAYDKFNNQELVWQKAIDELQRDLNDKADAIQVLSLRIEINKHLNVLRSTVNAMLEIVGEPRAAAITRKLHRDAACLSCATPAHIKLEEPGKVAALPAFQSARQPAVGAEAATRSKGDGDHGTCYRGLPLPHPRDPRSHVCQRYCGGSHTLLSNTISRIPPGITINPGLRPITTGPGTDGKIYMLDETAKKLPCLPCNVPKNTTPRTSIIMKTQESEQYDDGSDNMTPPDYRLISHMTVHTDEDNISQTPPPPFEDD